MAKSTIRKCDKCGYKSFRLDDLLGENKCKCGGAMKIFAREGDVNGGT